MKDHVYHADFVEVMDNGHILFDVDLGFGIRNQRPFRLYVDGRYTYDQAWDSIASWLSEAEEILVKSVRPRIGQYYADITFRRAEEWYNVTKLLIENQLVWGNKDASK